MLTSLPTLPTWPYTGCSESIGSARSINPSRLKRLVSTNAISEIRVWLLIRERGILLTKVGESSIRNQVQRSRYHRLTLCQVCMYAQFVGTCTSKCSVCVCVCVGAVSAHPGPGRGWFLSSTYTYTYPAHYSLLIALIIIASHLVIQSISMSRERLSTLELECLTYTKDSGPFIKMRIRTKAERRLNEGWILNMTFKGRRCKGQHGNMP